ncbi:hypothetical protein INT47_001663 [Mucor saturninus]|uniref:Uncharacterized protein n=1 Tax=Mucor saturninus TaxID=64648 RepID=A0A8H7VF81_9FUNG|nr:hypothetical protein INT47_001663 [Mucor saturninus]
MTNNNQNVSMEEEFRAEESYFYEYDQEMAEAVTRADEEDNDRQQKEDDDSLLRLIVDVQCYLSEAPTDSPLFALQYKMYTYLKQRASEMGMDVTSI